MSMIGYYNMYYAMSVYRIYMRIKTVENKKWIIVVALWYVCIKKSSRTYAIDQIKSAS